MAAISIGIDDDDVAAAPLIDQTEHNKLVETEILTETRMIVDYSPNILRPLI